jgi:hypothetical protein
VQRLLQDNVVHIFIFLGQVFVILRNKNPFVRGELKKKLVLTGMTQGTGFNLNG